MEVVWMVEVILAQTSPGAAFLNVATKDSAVRKQFGAGLQCLGFLAP